MMEAGPSLGRGVDDGGGPPSLGRGVDDGGGPPSLARGVDDGGGPPSLGMYEQNIFLHITITKFHMKFCRAYEFKSYIP